MVHLTVVPILPENGGACFALFHSVETPAPSRRREQRRYNRRMSRPAPHDPAQTPTQSPVPFGTPSSLSGGEPRNWLPWGIAAAVIVVAAIFLVVANRTGETAPGPNPYATNVAFSGLHLSQATNFAGDQLTYVEGTVTNKGDRTVTALTARVVFGNDEGEPPQTQEVPVNLIRAREPYVDTVPVSASPLKPGASQDFRLTFDSISPMWNQQIPAVSVASVQTAR
jgi:hypothetical protein